MSRTVAVDDTVRSHVAALGNELVGPRRVKADMLREVEHGLRDSVDALVDDGLSPQDAAARAVDEFGDVRQVARDYQAELVARQTRHALAFVAITGPVGEVVSRMMWTGRPPVRMPSEETLLLAGAVDIGGWTGSLVAAALLVLFGTGARWVPVRSIGVRAVAYGIGAKIVLIGVGAVTLSFLFGTSASTFTDPVVLVQALAHPLVWMYALWLAWRCLCSVRRFDRLRHV